MKSLVEEISHNYVSVGKKYTSVEIVVELVVLLLVVGLLGLSEIVGRERVVVVMLVGRSILQHLLLLLELQSESVPQCLGLV